MAELARIYAEIAERSDAIARDHAAWPCLRGCNGCCKNLPGLPVFTRAEWEHLWVGFRALPEEVRAGIREQVARLVPGSGFACPFLDPKGGGCRVYAHRPAICRAYGYYAAPDGGRWCEDVEEDLARRKEPVGFGDQEALDARLEAFGDPISIVEWFEQSAG